jgi:[protein-PII] uridylyltransferase
MTIATIQQQLLAAVDEADSDVAQIRTALKQAGAQLEKMFMDQAPIRELVNGRATFVDALLQSLWRRHFNTPLDIALVAVGGYGRGELHPASDIDLLILLSETDDEEIAIALSSFITLLWDIGLHVGQSVRTLQECREEAAKDITVATNLMEARFLCGNSKLVDQMLQQTGPQNMWPSDLFFKAKWQEQQQRHLKYDDTAHSLEPNVKEGPGGLRDMQMIGWVAKRHFCVPSLRGLVEHQFLTRSEYESLKKEEAHLWRVRFALHMTTSRAEDRLLFDYQRTLATLFGYDDDDVELGVEKFMRRYYLAVTELQRLNEMLLQYFQETILLKNRLQPPCIINNRFQTRNGFLEVRDKQLFSQRPIIMLELFLLMTQDSSIKGVRASTIRLIREHLHLIDTRLRTNPKAKQLFLQILKQQQGVFHALRRMNRYGILAAYIPDFANIVGRMQYDLFHVYTVDTHTLFVIRNLRRFTVAKYHDEFPLCSDVIATIPKQQLLVLAALFHDIAKGRGGDHSQLGEAVAYQFCREHGLQEKDSRLVAWLVRTHLLMSMTAQRKDIEDPLVIQEFAGKMQTPERLDYLYLLTVADMRATNPKRWNSWKASLLGQLYSSTHLALTTDIDTHTRHSRQIARNKQLAMQQLQQHYDENDISAHWISMSDNYFLQNSVDGIVWQTSLLFDHAAQTSPQLHIITNDSHGGSEILVIDRDRDNLFAMTTGLLDQLGLNIVHARIETAGNGISINSFVVLEEDGSAVAGDERKDEVKQRLLQRLQESAPLTVNSAEFRSRESRHFDVETRIRFSPDESGQKTIMRILTADCPGLLAKIGLAFSKCDIRLCGAKVATIGADVDNSFFITDSNNQPLSDNRQRLLQESVLQQIQPQESVGSSQ